MCALIAGCILRFAGLSRVPAGLYCDEAFQGYEAYSLLETGADSRGVAHPLFFDIFGVGWQEPLYVYLTMIPVRILGTTAAAARAVAAAGGTLALAAVAALAYVASGPRAAAAASILMAFSPWALHFSRTGFQASLLPLFLAAGGALLVAAARPGQPARRSSALLIAGGAVTAISLYTYVAARVLVPLLLFGYAVAFAGRLRRIGAPALALAGAAVLAVAVPVAAFTLTPEGRERFQDVGLSSRYSGAEAAGRFAAHYASYFSPGFLLTEGDPNPRHSVGGFGELHAQDLLLLTAGVLAALMRRSPPDLFLIWWLAIAPLPAAISADPRHAIRAIGAVPAIYALAGSGASALLARGGPLDPALRSCRIVIVLLAAASIASVAVHLHRYFVVYPVSAAPAFQYGLEEAYREVESQSRDHDSIYVTRMTDFPWIHRLYLFSFPPEEYQGHRFSRTKYLFDEPVFYRGTDVPGRRSPIFLLSPEEVPETGLSVKRTIPNPDGSPAFVVAW